jgi:hypothetical protein
MPLLRVFRIAATASDWFRCCCLAHSVPLPTSALRRSARPRVMAMLFRSFCICFCHLPHAKRLSRLKPGAAEQILDMQGYVDCWLIGSIRLNRTFMLYYFWLKACVFRDWIPWLYHKNDISMPNSGLLQQGQQHKQCGMGLKHHISRRFHGSRLFSSLSERMVRPEFAFDSARWGESSMQSLCIKIIPFAKRQPSRSSHFKVRIF